MMYGGKKNDALGKTTLVMLRRSYMGSNFSFPKISTQNCCFLLLQKWKLSTQSKDLFHFYADLYAFDYFQGFKQDFLAVSFTRSSYARYLDMASKGNFKPPRVPPNKSGAYYHGLQVHLQIVIRKMLGDSSLGECCPWKPTKSNQM